MAGTVYPVDAIAGVPQFTGRMLRDTASVLTSAATSARPFGAVSGCRPGTVATIGSVPTSTTWQVTPFGGIIDVEASNIAGVYQYGFAANQTGTIAAQGGSARWDRLDVQVSDPAEGDGTSAPVINIVYTQGTTTTLPPAPARSHPLYTIIVPASGGGSPTLLFTAPFTVAAGGIQPVPTTAYPASPYLGQYVDDAVLGLLRYNGTSFVTLGGDSGWLNVTFSNGWSSSGTLIGQYRKLNGVVYLRGRPTGGSTGTIFTLPAGFRPGAGAFLLVENGSTAGSATSITTTTAGVFSGFAGAFPVLDGISFIAEN